VLLAARRKEVLEELAGEIGATGGTAVAVSHRCQRLRRCGELGCCGCRAARRNRHLDQRRGRGGTRPVLGHSDRDHARLVDVNLKGLIYGAHIALWQFWAQGGGTLINVGSMDSEVPLAYQASYAATKAAVLSLSRSLTEELRLAGNEAIKIGTIMLCAVDTPWWTHAANYSGHAPRMAAMDDPQIVGDAIIAACTDPKEQRPVGVKRTRLTSLINCFLASRKRLSARSEISKAPPVPNTTGDIYRPMPEGTMVNGGVREREDTERDEMETSRYSTATSRGTRPVWRMASGRVADATPRSRDHWYRVRQHDRR
jgi:NAD(P)-dependent dehydrogenase (short-subunit alcohol dehydrogenase family)